MEYHRIADRHRRDPGSNGIDPARILVAECERRGWRWLEGSDPVQNMDVRSTDARSRDLDDHVQGVLDGRFLDFPYFRRLVDLDELDCLHPGLPAGSGLSNLRVRDPGQPRTKNRWGGQASRIGPITNPDPNQTSGARGLMGR